MYLLVLNRRTSRVILVLEASCDMFNQQAVLRTGQASYSAFAHCRSLNLDARRLLVSLLVVLL